MGLLGIILALALPSFAALLQDSRLTTSVNTLSSTLQHARSEAIKRGTPIVVCKGQAESGCEDHRNWSEGWLSCIDTDGNRIWSEGEAQLWSQSPLHSGNVLDYAAFPSSKHVIVCPEGTASSNGTFTFWDARGSGQAKALILAKSGRLRPSRKTSYGASLSCL